MLLGLIAILQIDEVFSICCAYCLIIDSTSSTCTQCNGGYFLESGICVLACGQGYSSDSANVCFQDGTSLTLVNTFFPSQTQYTNTIVGDFTTVNQVAFTDPSSMVPTSDRGFYASISSSLISQSTYATATQFSANLYAYPFSDGVLFAIGTYFGITMSNGEVLGGHFLLSQASLSEIQTTVLAVAAPSSVWLQILVEASQTTPTLYTMYINVNGFSSTSSIQDFELPKRNAVNIYMGTPLVAYGSASGFYYEVEIANALNLVPYNDLGINTCLFQTYWDGALCQPCDAACNPQISCITSGTCNTCVSSLCSDCIGYGPNDCLACTSGMPPTCANMCDPTCSTCTGPNPNECLTCDAVSYFLYKGICLSICPTGYSQIGGDCALFTPLESKLELNGVISYTTINDFNCGSDNTMYDINDPFPLEQRGYYFNASTYMSTALVLSPDLSLNLWINVQSDGQVISYKQLSVSSSGGMMFVEPTMSNLLLLISVIPFTTNIWNYISFEIVVPATCLSTVNAYLQSALMGSFSASSPTLFPVALSSLFIGDAAFGFTGFVWSMYIYNENGHLSDNIIFSTCPSGCSHCPTELICPSLCPFNNPPNSCTSTCPLMCLMCTQSSTCDGLCYPSAIMGSGGVCSCALGYTWDTTSNQCLVDANYFPCYDGCAVCDNYNFNGCTQCMPGFTLMLSTCMLFCPTGYQMSNAGCVLQETLVFDMVFDGIQGIVYDRQFGLPAVTGSSERFYPEYEANDPYAAYGRGYYFNGVSSIMRLPELEYSSPTFLFGPEVTIEVWIKSLQASGTIISKQITSTQQIIFQLQLVDSFITLSARVALNNGWNSPPNSVVEASLNTWIYFGIRNKYVGPGAFSGSYCYNYQTYDMGGGCGYVDDISSGFTMTIGAIVGADLLYSDFFNGFIYQIRMHNIGVDFIDVYTMQCDGDCDVCTAAGSCLGTCPIGSFGNETCALCETSCRYGCRSLENKCSLCNNLLCSSCEEYDSCEVCVDGAEVNGTACQCKTGFVNNGDSCTECVGILQDNVCESCNGSIVNNTCVVCGEGCSECDFSGCLLCEGQMAVIGEICGCSPGFEGVNCTQKELYLNVSINSLNDIFLIFSENLLSGLTLADMNFSCPGLILMEILQTWSDSKYLISITASTDIQSGTPMSIQFATDIYSESYAKLLITCYPLVLSEHNITKLSPLIDKFKSFAATATQSVLAAATSLSLANVSPSSLWSFISAIQLLVFIYLTNIPLSNRAKGFLIGLKKYNPFPNLFEYLGVYQGKTHQFARAVDLGFATNSVLLNVGNLLSLFLCLIGIYCVFRIVLRVTTVKSLQENKVRKYMREFCEKYKYGFFIRFLIQAYIEFFVASLITVYSSDLTDLSQAYNFYLAIIFLVLSIQFLLVLTPILSLGLSLSRRNEITNCNPTTMSLYGSLFYEFKDDSGAIRSHYYTLFFMRRLLFVVVLFVLEDYPIIQICLCEIFTLAVCYI